MVEELRQKGADPCSMSFVSILVVNRTEVPDVLLLKNNARCPFTERRNSFRFRKGQP